MWDKIMPALSALIGGLLGTGLTLGTVGWAEAEKLAETNRSRAYAEFAEAAWGTDLLLYEKKVSSLTVYGSSEVVHAHAAWVQMHCNDTERSKTPDCKTAWAEVIAAMRKDSGMSPADTQDIVDAIWEEG